MLFAADDTLAAETTRWMGLHPWDWAVLAVYLLMITGIGVWSYRKVHDMSDFFMGGRRFGKVFMMFFAFGSGTSSEQAVSVASGSFRNGLAGIWYQFLWLFATPFYWIIAPVFRRMRALTTSDFFEARYDTSTATLYSIVGVMTSIVFMSGALFGCGQMIQGLAGGTNPATGEPFFPASYAIAAMTVMFVAYGMAGGLGAAIITDFVQGVLTIVFSFMLLPFALYFAADVAGTTSGFAALYDGVPGRSGEQILNMTLTEEIALQMGEEPITGFYVLMLSITGLIGIVVQPHIMGVCGAGKTEFEGRFGFTFGNFIKRFCTVAWAFTGLACIVIYLTPGNGYVTDEKIAELQADSGEMRTFADGVFGLAAHHILPKISHGLVGLLFASLLAAVMSTCDAQMVVGSGLLTENVYRRFLVKNASKRHYLWAGRIAGLLIVGAALVLQTQFDNVIQVLTTYIQAIPAWMGLAFWFGIAWRAYTPAGVWAGTLTTAIAWFLTQQHKPFEFVAKMGESDVFQRNIDWLPGLVRTWIHDNHPSLMKQVLVDNVATASDKVSVPWQMLIYVGAGAIAGIGVSLLTKRTPVEKLNHFFKLIRTPVKPGEKVDVPCTLPEDHLPTEEGKLIPLADLEIPKPSLLGLGGFIAAWVLVGLIIWGTKALAQLGAP